MTKRLVMLVVLLFCSLILVSCGEKITAETLENLKFEGATVEYTGDAHSIFVENIYEDKGVTVQYTNNNKIAPGNYVVKAKISYKDYYGGQHNYCYKCGAKMTKEDHLNGKELH